MKFTLPFCSVSINQCYAIHRGRKIKTEKYKNLEREVDDFFTINRDVYTELKKMFDEFCPKLHIIVVNYTYFFDQDKILKKDGGIKRGTHDIENQTKALTDCIFKEYPRVDDAFIYKMTLEKRVGDNCIGVEIFLENRGWRC